MKSNNKHINQLLRRWISGDITAQEERELERAAIEDEFLRESLAAYRSQAAADHSHSLAKLRKQLPKTKAKAPVRRLRPWMRIAAAVALLIVAGWSVFQTQKLTDKSMAVAQNEAQEEPQNSVPSYDEKATAPNTAEKTESLSELSPSSESFTQTLTSPTPIPPPPLTTDKRQTTIVVPPPTTDIEQKERASALSTNDGFASSRQLSTAETEKKAQAAAKAAKDEQAVVLEPIAADAEDNIATTPPPPPSNAPVPNTYARQDQVLAPTNLEDRYRTTNAGIREPNAGFRLIEGTITDEEGYPLIGASILEEGSANGTVTDIDGNYQLTVNRQSSLLLVSYTGYETQSVVLSRKKEIDVVLSTNQVALDEVVVTGYADAPQGIEGDSAVSQAAPTDGYAALRDYIRSNIPTNSGRATIKLRFDIQTDGRPSNFSVIRSTNPSLNVEAIRLLENGPLWIIESGNAPVEVVYSVKFR